MNMSISARRWRGIAVGGLLLALAGATPTFAQEAAPAAAPAPQTATVVRNDGVVTPEAQAVLDRMTSSLNSLSRFSITADITRDELLTFGYKLQNVEKATILVERPNRLRLELNGDIKNRTYVYDGSNLTVSAPDAKLYSVAKAPSTLKELVLALLDAGVEMPLIDMLFHGAGGDLTENVRAGLVVGETMIDGVPTDHLAFRQPDLDWQLWVQKGPQALPRKMVITTRYSVGDPQYQATMKWNVNPPADPKAFTFVPPAGSTKVPNQAQLVADGGDK